MDERGHGLFYLQHSEGQQATGAVRDVPAQQAEGTPLRSSGVGSQAIDSSPGKIHPHVLRRRHTAAAESTLTRFSEHEV